MKVSKDNKRILIIIAAIVALIVAYQQIPHIYIGVSAANTPHGFSLTLDETPLGDLCPTRCRLLERRD